MSCKEVFFLRSDRVSHAMTEVGVQNELRQENEEENKKPRRTIEPRARREN